MNAEIAALCARYITRIDVVLTTNGCELEDGQRDVVASTVFDALERACPNAEVDVVWKHVWSNTVRLEVAEDADGDDLVSRYQAEEFIQELVREVVSDAYEATLV